MLDYIRVAAAVPPVVVGDAIKNAADICTFIRTADREGCDLVVFPSTKAHQAMPIYEAGMAERLMIISDFVNTREFLENEKNGLTFPPSNSEALAEKIKEGLDKDDFHVIW